MKLKVLISEREMAGSWLNAPHVIDQTLSVLPPLVKIRTAEDTPA